MPVTVNSKLTHYKIRQITTETKRYKNTQTAKMEFIVTHALLSIIVHVSMTCLFCCRLLYLAVLATNSTSCGGGLHNLPPPPVTLTFRR